jgi:signal transduction histidine kinase
MSSKPPEIDHPATETRLQEERRRLADVLHETLAQDLSFVSMTARRTVSGETAPDRMAAIAEAVDRMSAALRTILVDLNHPAEEGLREVLVRVAGQVAQPMGARVEVEVPPKLQASLQQKVTLSRVVRESVANAVRHGRATAIVVRAERDASGLRVEIADNGLGFDPAVDRRVDQFGLDSMRNAAEAIGGSVHVSSQPDRGTSVQVEVP